MKKFIGSIFKILINTIIFILSLALIFLVFIIILSNASDIAVEDTVSYITSYAQQITDFNLTDKELVNFYSEDNTTINNTTTTSTNNKFYYKQLDDDAKIIYNALENNIENLKEDNFTIKFSTKFNTLLNKSNGRSTLNKAFQSAVDAFFYDHPELFYIDLTKLSLVIKSTSIGSKTTYTVSIAPKDEINYLSDNFSSEAEVTEAISKIEYIRDKIISTLPDGTNYDKALKVHDILVSSLEYKSSNNSNIYNIYGALIEQEVVCEGYAKAFKYILDSLDIECILVGGNATNSSGKTEAHMWNYIKLDGNWYGVDVTWDDPIIIGGTLSKNIIRHNYFCKGSSVFNESHTVHNTMSDAGKSFSIPTLSNKNYK